MPSTAARPAAESSSTPPGAPQPFTVEALDGYRIHGFQLRHAEPDAARPVVIVNAATAVRCRYYLRFAEYLHRHGSDVIVYDYRGIGESKPPSLRGFSASWLDWGRLDFEAVLAQASHAFAGQPIDVVGHSIGGFVIGLAASNHRIRRVFTMGAQYAYWRDYAARGRVPMLFKWHVLMPALTAAFGYFPGRRLGWLEDVPHGVVRDWSRQGQRFEHTMHSRAGPASESALGSTTGGVAKAAATAQREALLRGFASVTAPILAVSVTDDPFGTRAAIERLLAYFSRSPRTHLRLAPADIDVPAIGHFAFFHSRFEGNLWPIARHWLDTGRLVADQPGTVTAWASGDSLRRGQLPAS